jgi:hypothetical protein
MGLDMYLKAERYLWYTEEAIGDEVKQVFPELPEGAKIKSVEAEVGYWRKANSVHQWFVDNVQGGVDECQKAFVSREDIQKLRDICQRIVDDPSQGEKILPTQSGFFFGSTEYSEWYMRDITDTIAICDRALSLPDDWELHYQSSW